MRFALLSELELRLVDRMFDAGVFRDVPASIRPPTDLGPAESRIGTLIPLASQVEAARRQVGGVVEHASVQELLGIIEARPHGEREPEAGTRP